MEDREEILQAINSLGLEMHKGFKTVNKRLDGIEKELKSIDKVLHYTDQANNVPQE